MVVIWQRLALAIVALVVGWMALPITALLLDTVVENLLLPISLVLAVGVCALAGAGLRHAAGADASRGRGAIVGGIAGLVAAIIGDIALFVLITG